MSRALFRGYPVCPCFLSWASPSAKCTSTSSAPVMVRIGHLGEFRKTQNWMGRPAAHLQRPPLCPLRWSICPMPGATSRIVHPCHKR